MSEGVETLTIRVEDDATDGANAAADALDRLAASQDAQAKAGIGGVAGEKQSTAFARLREQGTKAGSALAASFAGVENRMANAVTATNRLISALQLAKNRAKEIDSADARKLSEDMARANRLPTALQAPPPAAFTAAQAQAEAAQAIATASQAAGSAQRAAAHDALEFATAAAEAATGGRALASVYDLVAARAAAAARDEAKAFQEQVTRANRLPTALQAGASSGATLESRSKEAGSALGASAHGALEEALDAAKGEAGVKRLASVYDLVARRAAAAAKEEEKAFAVAVEKANKLPKSLQPQQAEPKLSGLQKLLGTVRGVFGDKAAGGLAAGAQKLAAVDESMGGKLLPALAAGAGAYGAAATVVVAAATALAAITYKVLSAVASASIEASDRKTKALAGLGAGGEETYKIAVASSVKLGSDLDATITQVKGLITTGFAKDRVPVILEAVADIRIAKGDDAANALQ
ncbi:MAG: hypothetical protein ABI134_13720, partial [Byssovorax sp.]